jgi:tetratricopeptide (TPR) repeat protein
VTTFSKRALEDLAGMPIDELEKNCMDWKEQGYNFIPLSIGSYPIIEIMDNITFARIPRVEFTREFIEKETGIPIEKLKLKLCYCHEKFVVMNHISYLTNELRWAVEEIEQENIRKNTKNTEQEIPHIKQNTTGVLNYYMILGVRKTASKEEIEEAYRGMAKKFHPDIYKDPESEERFKLINEAHRVLSDEQNYVDAWYNRAVTLGKLGRHSEALASCDKAISLNPNHTLAWNCRGNALDELGRHSEALTSCDKAISLNSNYALAWNSRGNALFGLGRYSDAVASFDKAIAINPDFAGAWNNRGIALGRLGEYSEALTSYDKAIAINQDYTEAWNNRGVTLSKLGRYSEALTSHDKAIAINSNNSSAWNNRGSALFSLSRYSEAVKSYDKALATDPNNTQTKHNREIALKKIT